MGAQMLEIPDIGNIGLHRRQKMFDLVTQKRLKINDCRLKTTFSDYHTFYI